MQVVDINWNNDCLGKKSGFEFCYFSVAGATFVKEVFMESVFPPVTGEIFVKVCVKKNCAIVGFKSDYERMYNRISYGEPYEISPLKSE
jgi:hypothetical protein